VITVSMPRFLVLSEMKPPVEGGVPWSEMTNATVVLKMLKEFNVAVNERVYDELKNTYFAIVKASESMEQCVVYDQRNWSLSGDDGVDNIDSPSTQNDVNGSEGGGSLLHSNETVDHVTTFCSSRLRRAAVQTLHSTIGTPSGNSSANWTIVPPSHARQHFGMNAWWAVACSWTIVGALVMLTLSLWVSKRSQWRIMDHHRKYL
jgi:hypothetical protein